MDEGCTALAQESPKVWQTEDYALVISNCFFLSHIHYDHHRGPGDFTASKFAVSHGALQVLEKVLPGAKVSH